MEFDFCGQFLNEKVLCVLYVVKIGTKEHAVVENWTRISKGKKK